MCIYLYVKTHRKTGLKYLGKTTKKDPHAYHGSGADWKIHLKEHGYDYDTEIIRETGGGGNHTAERKELYRQQQLGKKKPPRTKEHIKNLSNACKGKPKPRSDQHQQAWIESSKKNWETNLARKEQVSQMGKAKKEHRKRVAARNQRIKSEQTKIQKMFNESIQKQLEELKKQRETEMSGETQTTI